MKLLFLTVMGSLVAVSGAESLDLRKWLTPRDLHHGAVFTFVSLDGQGVGRVPGVQARHQNVLITSGKQFRVSKIELIGLLKKPEARVYLTDEFMQKKDGVAAAQTRSLTPAEASALARIKKGEEIAWDKAKGERRQMVGALRANSSCLQCHDGKSGDLLGALLYTLEEVPDVPVAAPIPSALPQKNRT